MIGAGLITRLVLIIWKIEFKKLFSNFKNKNIILPVIFISMLGLSIVASEWNNFFIQIFPISDLWMEIFESMIDENYILISIFAISITAPIVEEYLFRGILLKGFIKRHRKWFAICFSAFIFSVIHLNPWQAVPAFAFGIIAGLMFYRNEKLWMVIFAHASYNSMSFIIGLFGIGIANYNMEGK